MNKEYEFLEALIKRCDKEINLLRRQKRNARETVERDLDLIIDRELLCERSKYASFVKKIKKKYMPLLLRAYLNDRDKSISNLLYLKTEFAFLNS
jgi:hypothetical protein